MIPRDFNVFELLIRSVSQSVNLTNTTFCWQGKKKGLNSQLPQKSDNSFLDQICIISSEELDFVFKCFADNKL